MGSDDAAGRQFGQRSLPRLFQLRTSSLSTEGASAKSSKKSVSLSEFLDRKLGKNKQASTGGSLQQKRFPFPDLRSASVPLAPSRNETSKSVPIDDAVLRQYISRPKPETSSELSINGESEDPSQLVTEEFSLHSRKRKNQNLRSAEDGGESTTPKLLVLGDDPKPRRNLKVDTHDPRIKPQFDHYASGSGLWDSDREGVDGEEVGFKEVWEGVGSASLGGLEWH